MSYWKHKIEGVDWTQYKLADREHIFQHIAKEQGGGFEQPPYAIVWEDPNEPERPARVTVPTPAWWAMALHGGILPPVWVYHELKKDEAQPDFKRHTRGLLLHATEPMGPMTEEEAMEYLLQKDVPTHVWAEKRNSVTFKIVPRTLVPSDRSYRNAWKLKQEAA